MGCPYKKWPFPASAAGCAAVFIFIALAASGWAAPAGDAALGRMIGAMLMFGFRGQTLPDGDPFLESVSSGRVGGVLLFDRDVQTGAERNIRSPAQLSALTSRLVAAAPGPIFVAIDQEGGKVRRLRPEKGFMDLPSARTLGRRGTSATLAAARGLGRELKGLGINVDLAPVADVDTNPDNPAIGSLGRAFSSDPYEVAGLALAFGRGLSESGVIPVLKHFPGQGCASADSHLGVADISGCWSAPTDLLPYAEIFREGWPGMVMIGHVLHRGLDNAPATLSANIVTGLLRRGLGFDGVVLSDDMQMRAISGRYDLSRAILMAVRAGVDILVFGNNQTYDPDLPERAYAALADHVKLGRISRQRIEESYRRIMSMHRASGR